MVAANAAQAIREGKGAIAICLECEWSSPVLRNTDAAEARAEIHNRLKH